ncbi:MAG: glutamate--tRNA ligase [Nitrospinae bacterium]|nr:glutamate--tRNA ligase [Nitrospinota bacterium]
MTVRTRFAPSPTGTLHLGGARTALFNWLWARNQGGKFILRIEDTDKERSTLESVDEILASLKWLGLNWDEGPFFQSQRTALYEEKVEKLLREGKAYRCYCTKEELDASRAALEAAGKKPMYNRVCREKTGGDASRPNVVRLKAPLTGVTSFTDSLRGVVEFNNTELDDFIIRRTDGGVMYNFVVVVDDAEMGITHVIRGDDHLANTPKQVQLYKALGYDTPRFTHVSMILGPDKKRLSKRHGAESVMAYRDMGYLPDAMLNCFARMGWGFGNQEIFARQELIEKFSLDKITMSPAVFDITKLESINMQHMKAAPDAELARLALPFLHKSCPDATAEKLAVIVPLLKERSRTLVEMAAGAEWYFVKDVVFQPEAKAKFITAGTAPLLEQSADFVLAHSTIVHDQLSADFKEFAAKMGKSLKDIAQPVRVALTGRTVSPGVFEMMEALGKEETARRLKAAAKSAGG